MSRRDESAEHTLAKIWGDVITFDHVNTQRATMVGLNGEREALTVRDVATGLSHMYPPPP